MLLFINAFADPTLHLQGNPAAVALLAKPADPAWMQALATKLNLSETAFLHPDPSNDAFRLRWFTPSAEVDLCGHATLAAAHALWSTNSLPPTQPATFLTNSGTLTCTSDPPYIHMDFPLQPPEPLPAPLIPPLLTAARNPILAAPPQMNRFDFLLHLTSEHALRNFFPNLELLAKLPARGLIVTAPSSNPNFDFVSRFFAPAFGIDEDPVTGSAHCALAPYWQNILNKSSFTALQASSNGGLLKLQIKAPRLQISGQAITLRTEPLPDSLVTPKSHSTPIETCPTCTTLPNHQELNYENNHPRPAALDHLEIITLEHTDESAEAWRELSLRRCPVCGTCYAIRRSKDEGHSFMDPTEDTEEFFRLTPIAALDLLPTLQNAPSIDTLKPKIPPSSAPLFQRLTEDALTTPHIRQHACEYITHEALLSNTPSAQLQPLLHHPNPDIPLDTLHELLGLATKRQSRVGYGDTTRLLQTRALDYLTAHSPIPILTAILRNPIIPSPPPSSSNPTQCLAAQLLGTTAYLGFPFDDPTTSLIASLLPAPDVNLRFHLTWALLHSIKGSTCPPDRAALIRPYFNALPEDVRTHPLHKMLGNTLNPPTEPPTPS